MRPFSFTISNYFPETLYFVYTCIKRPTYRNLLLLYIKVYIHIHIHLYVWLHPDIHTYLQLNN